MVIKDVLKKLNSSNPNDPKVLELRKKLAKIKGQQNNSDEQKPAQQPSKGNKPSSQQSTRPPNSSNSDMETLAKASEDEQRAFAQEQNPLLRVKEEKTHKLVTKQVGELIELVTGMGKRITKLEQEKSQTKQHIEKIEKHNKDLNEKMEIIDGRLEKFMSLYEIITNQYNPFSEKQQIPEPSSQPVSNSGSKVEVTDELTGQQQAVDFKQGQMTSVNKQKIDQLLRDLEADEEGEAELSIDEQEEVQEQQQQEMSQSLKEELHGLFGSFEDRMKTHVNESVQKQLHEALGDLEETLDDEVDEAIEENIDALKDHDDIIANALQELTKLENESTNLDAYKQDEQEVEQHVHSIDDQIKAIPPSLYFRLHNNRILKSVDDLTTALQEMDKQVFVHHVNESHNDFADWLELALQDPRGPKIRDVSQEEMVTILTAQS
jgi:archaellum component FlaC